MRSRSHKSNKNGKKNTSRHAYLVQPQVYNPYVNNQGYVPPPGVIAYYQPPVMNEPVRYVAPQYVQPMAPPPTYNEYQQFPIRMNQPAVQQHLPMQQPAPLPQPPPHRTEAIQPHKKDDIRPVTTLSEEFINSKLPHHFEPNYSSPPSFFNIVQRGTLSSIEFETEIYADEDDNCFQD